MPGYNAQNVTLHMDAYGSQETKQQALCWRVMWVSGTYQHDVIRLLLTSFLQPAELKAFDGDLHDNIHLHT